MFQKYYSDNLISKFIKCLLWDTYIPTVDIWRPGKSIIKGFTYITYDRYIVKAEQDYISSLDVTAEYRGPKTALDSNYFKVISKYVDGEWYPGITSNYQSNSALYDPNTHYYLGQYLRMIRDLDGIDLMPFYNCYSGEMSDKIRILDDDSITTTNNKKDGKNLYIVPIKFNKQYSIYFNSAVPFKIKPVYYNGISVKEVKYTNNNTPVKSDIVTYSSNTQPYIYSLNIGADNLRSSIDSTSKLIEDYLVLLIQAPEDVKSSLTVIEGPISSTDKQIYWNTKLINNNTYINRLPNIYLNSLDDLSDIELNEIYKPMSSLITYSGTTSYAFSNKLIEYLLNNVITKNERIRDNILRVQQTVSSTKAKEELGKDYYSAEYKKDIWNNNLRAYIYNLVTQYYKVPLCEDVNGFIDKDTEFIIDQFKIVNKEWGE